LIVGNEYSAFLRETTTEKLPALRANTLHKHIYFFAGVAFGERECRNMYTLNTRSIVANRTFEMHVIMVVGFVGTGGAANGVFTAAVTV
jgi:hypothetical protein